MKLFFSTLNCPYGPINAWSNPEILMYKFSIFKFSFKFHDKKESSLSKYKRNIINALEIGKS